MLNIDAFRDLCRKASIEKNPAERDNLKDALRLIFALRKLSCIVSKRTLA